MAKVIYDSLGNEIQLGEKPPEISRASIARVRDRWAGRTAGDITPELAARVLRGDADLSLQMAVAKRLLLDPHIYTCMRNLVYGVSRLKWEVLPFDAKSRAAIKQADEARDYLRGMRFLKKLQRYLMFGEHYPFVGSGLIYDEDFNLADYVRINHVRWKWDDEKNLPRLLTAEEPVRGVSIEGERRGYAIYMAELEPGSPRESGLWRKALWLWMFRQFTWASWVRFAEAFGNPYIWAFFSRPEDKESVYDAVIEMDANARGVFPEGTEIKLQEAQRYSTTALYEAIIEAAQDGTTKLYLGHVLNTEVKSGSGTLAGNAAADVSQTNKEGVADNLEETMQEDIVRPWCEWHFGEAAVERNEIPLYKIKSEPPEDLTKKSTVYVTVNQALASAGRAIDPEQIEEEFEVRTVEVARRQPPGEPDPDGNSSEPPKKKARRAAAVKPPRINSPEDVAAASVKLVQKAAEDFSERIYELFQQSDSIESGMDIVWEGYAAMETTRLASAMRDVTVAAELMGRGDVEE